MFYEIFPYRSKVDSEAEFKGEDIWKLKVMYLKEGSCFEAKEYKPFYGQCPVVKNTYAENKAIWIRLSCVWQFWRFGMKLLLKTLTPVHIGNGETLKPLSYVIDRSFIYAINMEEFFKKLEAIQKKDVYLKWIEPILYQLFELDSKIGKGER